MKNCFTHLTSKTSQKGQIGVIILLTMAGMLTVGLSLAARTTQESLLAGKESQSARVFNAAEEGVEEALSGDFNFEGVTTSSQFSVDDIDVNYSITKVHKLETKVFEGTSVEVDVKREINQPGDVLRIDWSKQSNCSSEDPASLMVAVYYESADGTQVRYHPIAACDRGDGFETASSINANGYYRRYDLTLEPEDFLVRVKPIYNDTNVNISASNFDLPVQFYSIRSAATNQNGDENRIVEVNRTLSAAPSIFDYVVFSGTNIIK